MTLVRAAGRLSLVLWLGIASCTSTPHGPGQDGTGRTAIASKKQSRFPGLSQAHAQAAESGPRKLPSSSSGDMLDRLWTRDELRGNTGEARSHRLPAPDREGPQPSGIAVTHAARGRVDRTTIRGARPEGGAKLVALTFDLCERDDEVAGYDAAIVNYLRDQQVRATFFAGGRWMASHPEKTMQLMADPQFELGNHSWSHLNLRQQPPDVVEREIAWPQIEYALLRDRLAHLAREKGVPAREIDRVPTAPRLFRFPFGTCTPEALGQVAEQGLRAIQWDVVTGDPAPKQTASGIVSTVLGQVKPGSIVIMHANGRGHGTAEALRQFVPALRARGFEFVTVSELLARAQDLETADECYELRPGDNRRYDRLSSETSPPRGPATRFPGGGARIPAPAATGSSSRP